MPDHPLFRFGLPPDAVAWGALAVGALIFGLGRFQKIRALFRRSAGLRSVPWFGAAAAALLSALYFQYYLGGAPRVIDATAYLLESRLFALGEFTFTPPDPSALFRGRFLLHPPDDPLRLGVLFPPGYPLLLASAELVFDYRALGPALAAALVLTTAALALEVTGDRRVAACAALFSALCACLRYHTADTMSHGASALEATLLVWLSLRLSRRASALDALGFGAAGGLLCATRELTGLVFVGACGLFLAWRAAQSSRFDMLSARAPTRSSPGAARGTQAAPRSRGAARLLPLLGSALLSAAPFLALSLLHHRELTGSFFGSPQLRYYALADGPSGCFGLGFGTGCAFEHADVVRAHGGGLTPLWALRHTLNRLHAHAMDLAQFEPLALLALFWIVKNRRTPSGALFLLLLAALPFAYAFFYFDGGYPGGGARLLAELLPLEQVALAAFLVERGWSRAGVSLGLVGFALHASYSHAHLRDHMPGAPPAAVFDAPTSANPGAVHEAPRVNAPELTADRARLVFVEGDHAFLAHFDPRALPRASGEKPRGLLVARRSHDVRELWLHERLGVPSTFVLEEGGLAPWSPPSTGGPAATEGDPEHRGGAPPRTQTRFVLEAEADWPPLAVRGAWMHPSYPPDPCVSRGRALAFEELDSYPPDLVGSQAAPRAPREADRQAANAEDARARDAKTRSFVFDAGGAPPGNYEVDAVFWTSNRRCWRAPLGRFALPARLTIPLPETPDETLHLDSVELRLAPGAPQED